MKALAPITERAVRVYSFILFALLMITTSATARAQGSATRVESFSLKPNGEVVVENSRGSTRVEGWDSQTVRVVAEKKSNGATLSPGELILMGAGNSVIIQSRPGTERIDLTIYIPNTAKLQLTGSVWPVDIIGGFANSVVETTSGNIAYRLPANDDALVAMRSATGSVRSTVPLTSVEKVGVTSLQGQLGTGVSSVNLNSINGVITLAPGPNLSSKAKAAKAELAAAPVNQPASGAAGSLETATSAGTQPQNRGQKASRDQVQSDNDRDSINTRQAVQSNGSTVFAGSDSSNESSSTYKSGPYNRPRREQNTNSGNSGLNVRIIPSNGSPQRSSSIDQSVFDQAADEEDQDAHHKKGSGSGKTSGSANGNWGNGSIGLGGSDRSDVGSSKSRVGPMERDRQVNNMSGGNSGLRVRIIPANAPPGPTRESNSVFDQREESERDAPEPSTGNRGTASTRQSNQPYEPASPGAGRRPEMSARIDEEMPSRSSRESGPPVLNRSRGEEPPIADNSAAPETKANNADEEAIVLKAALVSLQVSVTNRSGIALPNLKKEDFTVAENGESQRIEFFQPTTAPFNLVLALDLSGSIKDKLEIVKSAALKFVDVLGPQDKIAVVTFTDEIRVVSSLTSDREELKRRIKAIDRSQGGTAFYEAMWFALVDTLRGTRGQRNAIVVMTDGVDSSLDRYNPMQTRVSFNQLAHRLEESDVIVFPIYLDTEYEEVFERGNSSSEAYATARDQLDKIGEVTGGQVFKAEKFGDLSGVYKQIAAAIRTVYSVGYYPTNAERDGTFRRVRVNVNRADASVRTRKGYYAK
ncbi:MAG TPA: VWA domain-containing protein [Blastocatellia bacterium]|nr:VWA domain-containing protein [Blastocatellia bacterium]